MARIGSLFVNLALEDASFISGLKRAQKEQSAAMRSMAKSADFAVASFKGLASAAVGLFSVATIKNALDYAGSIGEVSTALGVSTKELQVYRYAASQANLSQEQIEKALGKLTLELGRNEQAFAAVGVKTRDARGQLLSAGEVLPGLAEKLAMTANASEKAQIAYVAFGRSGQQMIPLLEGGAAGLKGFADEAERAGLILSDSAIQNADIAADKLAQFQQVLSVSVAAIVAENANSIVSLGNAITELTPAIAKGISATISFAQQSDAALARFSSKYALTAKARAGFKANADSYTESFLKNSSSALGFQFPNAAVRPVVAPPADAAGFSPSTRRAGAARGGGSRAAKAAKDVVVVTAAMKEADMVARQFQETAERLADEALTPLAASIGLDEGGLLASVSATMEAWNRPFQKAAEFGREISDNLAAAIVNGQDLGTALVNSLKAAAAEAISSGIFKLLLGDGTAGGSGVLTSVIGSIFGGFRANGGPVSSGKAYMVGERGPELFMPRMGGSIVPNGAGGAITFDLRGAVVTQDLLNQMNAIANRSAAGAVAVMADAVRQQRRPTLATGRG